MACSDCSDAPASSASRLVLTMDDPCCGHARLPTEACSSVPEALAAKGVPAELWDELTSEYNNVLQQDLTPLSGMLHIVLSLGYYACMDTPTEKRYKAALAAWHKEFNEKLAAHGVLVRAQNSLTVLPGYYENERWLCFALTPEEAQVLVGEPAEQGLVADGDLVVWW